MNIRLSRGQKVFNADIMQYKVKLCSDNLDDDSNTDISNIKEFGNILMQNSGMHVLNNNWTENFTIEKNWGVLLYKNNMKFIFLNS